MSPEALVDSLAPIRLPADFTSFGPLDGLVGFALGMLVALLVRALLPAVTIRKETPLAMARRRIAALAGLTDDERLFQLALLMGELAPARRSAGAALYDPDVASDPGALERAILEVVRPEDARG